MSKTADYVITKLVKTYNKTKVLDIAELGFRSGQFIALMGKNGSGKSTLLRLLARQELFDSGEIQFRGESLSTTTVEINPVMTFISEEHELPFTVPVSYWIDANRRMYPEYDEKLLARLLEVFEIDATKTFHSLSRGQKMKALLCIEAPKRPMLYLLDEITAVLDSGSRWSMMQFLAEEIARGCLVVMSTNIAGELQGFATDVVLMDKGAVRFTSAVKNLKNHYRKVRVPGTQDEKALKEAGARRISFNTDSNWIYMHDRSSSHPLLKAADEDQREVTIAEIQSFFTASKGDL